MTTKSESHTSANKKVESSRLKHLHVTVQESSQKPSANDAELSTSDDQNRESSEIIWQTTGKKDWQLNIWISRHQTQQ